MVGKCSPGCNDTLKAAIVFVRGSLKPNIHGATLMQLCCMQHFHVKTYVQHPCNMLLHFDPKCMSVGACGVVIALLLKKRSRRHSRNRKVWVREWVKNRQRFGAYHQLVQELRLADSSTYRNFLRMDVPTFDELLKMVGPLITYQDTNMRQAISPGERLALTLRFLATGGLVTFFSTYLYMYLTNTNLH